MKIGVLFDLDGTLLNTLEDLADATNAALRAFGYPERTLEEVRRFVGNGAGRLIRLAVPEGVDPAPVLAWFQEYYRLHCQIKTRAYPGIPEALGEIQRDFPVAIVSNKPDAAVKSLCAQYFPGIYARGESGDCPRKPAPQMVFRAMETIGAETCIYVGDSEVDVATAKNAEVPCLSVLWGFREKQSIGGTWYCEKPEELPECIRLLAKKMEG